MACSKLSRRVTCMYLFTYLHNLHNCILICTCKHALSLTDKHTHTTSLRAQTSLASTSAIDDSEVMFLLYTHTHTHTHTHTQTHTHTHTHHTHHILAHTRATIMHALQQTAQVQPMQPHRGMISQTQQASTHCLRIIMPK
jgi:hypothetical protein